METLKNTHTRLLDFHFLNQVFLFLLKIVRVISKVSFPTFFLTNGNTAELQSREAGNIWDWEHTEKELGYSVYRKERDGAVTMETPLRVTADCEVRVIIWWYTAQGKNVVQIHNKLVVTYDESIMMEQMVWRWQQKFREGWEELHNELQSCWPSDSITEENINTVRKLVEEDNHGDMVANE